MHKSQTTHLRGSGRDQDYHIVQRGAMYAIYDRQGRYRCAFPTRLAAEQHIAALTTRHPAPAAGSTPTEAQP